MALKKVSGIKLTNNKISSSLEIASEFPIPQKYKTLANSDDFKNFYTKNSTGSIIETLSLSDFTEIISYIQNEEEKSKNQKSIITEIYSLIENNLKI